MRFILILVLMGIVGCDSTEPGVIKLSDIEVQFNLSDLNNNVKTSFITDEINFNLIIKNNSAIDLTFSSSNPTVIFQILQSEKELCSSIDYLTFTAQIIEGKLESGKIIQYNWLAPNTAGRTGGNNIINLAKGKYIARVVYSAFFNEISLPSKSEIEFTIE